MFEAKFNFSTLEDSESPYNSNSWQKRKQDKQKRQKEHLDSLWFYLQSSGIGMPFTAMYSHVFLQEMEAKEAIVFCFYLRPLTAVIP